MPDIYTGGPLPPFINIMDDARWWAGMAGRTEKKAYCLAAFEAMDTADQVAFLQFVRDDGMVIDDR